MSFKSLLALAAAAFLLIAAPITAYAYNGDDIAATVPRLLTATSDRDARVLECTLGDAVSDAVRVATDADIAIINGGDLVRNLLPGDITWDALKATFKEDRILATVNVTPKTLRNILEAGLSHITIDNTEAIDIAASAYDGFPQISGFVLKYDASAPAGQRVYEVKYGGEPLDLEADQPVLKLAATSFMLSGGYDLPVVEGATPSAQTLSEAMASYMNQDMPDYVETGSRIYPMGTRNGSFAALFPMGLAFIIILLIVIGNGQRFKHMYNFER